MAMMLASHLIEVFDASRRCTCCCGLRDINNASCAIITRSAAPGRVGTERSYSCSAGQPCAPVQARALRNPAEPLGSCLDARSRPRCSPCALGCTKGCAASVACCSFAFHDWQYSGARGAAGVEVAERLQHSKAEWDYSATLMTIQWCARQRRPGESGTIASSTGPLKRGFQRCFRPPPRTSCSNADADHLLHVCTATLGVQIHSRYHK